MEFVEKFQSLTTFDRVQQIILQKLRQDSGAENPGVSQPAVENEDPSTSGDDIQEDETTPEDKMDQTPPAKGQESTDHNDQKGVLADVASKKLGMYLCLV